MIDRSQIRAGARVEDYCRPCKTERRHTVLATPGEVGHIRVLCDYCGSQHNYRGGRSPQQRSAAPGQTPRTGTTSESGAFPAVSPREKRYQTVSEQEGGVDLESLLRQVIREESGLTPVVPADRWRDGELVLRPGREGLQEKSWPIETFFAKIVMLRNRLRVMEQQINASELPADAKVKLQGYLTACYGSLTSFNVLFADEDDRFKGAGGKS